MAKAADGSKFRITVIRGRACSATQIIDMNMTQITGIWKLKSLALPTGSLLRLAPFFPSVCARVDRFCESNDRVNESESMSLSPSLSQIHLTL